MTMGNTNKALPSGRKRWTMTMSNRWPGRCKRHCRDGTIFWRNLLPVVFHPLSILIVSTSFILSLPSLVLSLFLIIRKFCFIGLTGCITSFLVKVRVIKHMIYKFSNKGNQSSLTDPFWHFFCRVVSHSKIRQEVSSPFSLTLCYRNFALKFFNILCDM
jgi:hypothetical protein